MSHDEFQMRLLNLIETYRARCLWSWPRHYMPREQADIIAVLGAIERHGDRAAFQEVAALRQWLSQTSSNVSATS